MKKALRRILDGTCDDFYCYGLKVLDFKDPEDVHQMRVAGRTLLSYFYVLADDEEMSRPRLVRLRRPLRRTMRLLGAIRDADVLIGEMEGRSGTFSPEEKALIDGWLNQKRVERTRLRKRLAAELPGYIGDGWKKGMGKWIKKVSGNVDKPTVEARVARLRKKKERSMKAIRTYAEPDMTDEIFLDLVHGGRISVKRLRYALGILKKLDAADKGEIDALKALQDQLGHVQDLRVWAGQLREHYGGNAIVDGITARWLTEMSDSLGETGIMNAYGSNV
jgi:CHAD domain-containing protein